MANSDFSQDPNDYERTDREEKQIEGFLQQYFDEGNIKDSLHEEEIDLIGEILSFVEENYDTAAYYLGLPIDFALLANAIRGSAEFDPSIDEDNLFERFERVNYWHGQELSTLSMRDKEGTRHGIRKFENQIRTLFHDGLDRLDYPSAPGHNTSQWERFPGILAKCFQLSEGARFVLVNALLDFGLDRMNRARTFKGNPRVRIFPRVVRDYPRARVSGENAGVVFQGIAYGYVRADRPHLSTIVDKVRTGSRRQKRIGDIDCYKDVSVELSIEVKDLQITAGNASDQLGRFVKDIRRGDILGVALVRDVTDEARTKIEDERIIIMTQDELLEEVRRWDWPKQDGALRDLVHYLAHIEQNQGAVDRLRAFIHEHDSDHDLVEGIRSESEEASRKAERSN